MKKSVAIIGLTVLAGGGLWWCFAPSKSNTVEKSDLESERVANAPAGLIADARSTATAGLSGEREECPSADEAEEALSPEEKREAAEEKQVDAFDALTDSWMDPEKKAPTIKEIDAFHAQFKGLPKDRKDECLHRALNLIPDENVMLLVGILMDKSEDRELVELVFNDVLNRDEEVKKPILQTIYKDRKHPCWTDVAWILDVTGERSND